MPASARRVMDPPLGCHWNSGALRLNPLPPAAAPVSSTAPPAPPAMPAISAMGMPPSALAGWVVLSSTGEGEGEGLRGARPEGGLAVPA